MNASDSLEFNGFALKDQGIIQQFVDKYKPLSCEYNFSNLFCWQKPSQLSWTMYQNRVVIYDNIDKCMFMPLGEKLPPEELSKLSQSLHDIGLKPDLNLVNIDYIEEFAEIKDHYTIKEERDYAEYIYDVNRLCDLRGKKLSKKRNLISQFKRAYPDFEVHLLASSDSLQKSSLKLAMDLSGRQAKPLDTLVQEFKALETAFDCFDKLGFEGIAVLVKNMVVAFSIFSPLNNLTYDIQFEKSDSDFKGVSQVVNHETAKYLQNKCQYLNKEQDLGIKGLRKAKLSYDPEKLVIPYTLNYKHKG